MDIATNLFTGRVLFVCSAVRKGRCTEAVAEQSRGLKKKGVKVAFFQLEQGGAIGYLKGIFLLRRFLKQNQFEVIHAHYGLSAVVASLAGARSLVVSLMGSDIFGPRWLLWLVRFFSAFFWPCVIVKSKQMADLLRIRGVRIIPNGVDLTLFQEIPREEARIKLGCFCRKIVLWPANPDREVKNVRLALDAMKFLTAEQVELKIIYDVPTHQMPLFYNSAEVVLVTSRWEGSPNVVKEALACNVPVVSTPVGDVSEWLQQIEGCEVVPPNPEKVAEALRKVIRRGKRVTGREVIEELDIDRVSARLMNEYLAVSLTTQGRRR